jgi:hypothetical protein
MMPGAGQSHYHQQQPQHPYQPQQQQQQQQQHHQFPHDAGPHAPLAFAAAPGYWAQPLPSSAAATATPAVAAGAPQLSVDQIASLHQLLARENAIVPRSG